MEVSVENLKQFKADIPFYFVMSYYTFAVTSSIAWYGLGMNFWVTGTIVLALLAGVVSIMACLPTILHSFLLNLILPRLKKLLLHIPYFKKRHIRKISIQETKVGEIVEPKEGRTDLYEIRQAQQQESSAILYKRRLIAIHYTRSIFAHYALDSEIEYLCDCLDLYIQRKGLANIRSVKISDKLATIDICHFGWNIWNHFRITNQDEIAEFLKVVFADALRNVDIKTVKSKLKESGGKYIKTNETIENV